MELCYFAENTLEPLLSQPYLLILLLDVQEHEVRLNGSSKSHWPIDVTSFKLSVFINDVVNLDIEFCEVLLLQKKSMLVFIKTNEKGSQFRTLITNYS